MSKTLGRSSSSSSSFSGSTTNATTAAGTSLHLPNWTSSSSTPANSSGVDGDFHLNTATNKIYKRVSGVWNEVAHLAGPTGLTGQQGPAGVNGTHGTNGEDGADGADAWLSGTSVPEVGILPDGTFFFDTDDHKIYKIVSGSWALQADITGPIGPQGPSGTADTWSTGTDDPAGGSHNEFYFESDTHKVWRNNNGNWGVIADLTGPTGQTGNTGPQGDTGSQGTQGIQGPQGSAGPTGPQGNAGTNGTNGTDGATWTSGTDPAAGGSDGDFYFKTNDHTVHKNTGGSWSQIADVTGDTGAQGIQGETGTTGAAGSDGNVWRQDSGVPGGGLGDVGDFYLDSTSRSWYEKTGETTWTIRGSFLVTPDWDAVSGAAFIDNKPNVQYESAIPEITSTAGGLMADADAVKFNGIATGATANDTDVNLKARANHTGTQTAATISDFDTEVSNNTDVTANTAKVSNVQANWTQATTGAQSYIQNKPTDITSTAGGLLADADAVKFASIATGATANDTDTNLKARANHTGTQASSTITTSGTNKILGRDTAGAGAVEELDAASIRGIINVANGASANSTDAHLLGRANHTGTQAASTISDFDTEVANNTDVTANTAKVGITTAQASAITANTAKVGITTSQAAAIVANTAKTDLQVKDEDDMASNSSTHLVTQQSVKAYVDSQDHAGITDLSATANGTSLTIESSTGNNAALPAATTSAWGVMSDDDKTKLDGIETAADVTDATSVTAAGALMKSVGGTVSDSINIERTNTTGTSFTGTAYGEGFRVTQTDYSVDEYISLIEAPYDESMAKPHVRIGAKFGNSGSEIVFGTSNAYSSGITNKSVSIDHTGLLKADNGATVTGSIAVSGTVDGRDVATDGAKLDDIEPNADVTDTANVLSAGAWMSSYLSASGLGCVLDQDDMASNSATKLATQQSIKSYVDNEVSGLVGGAPGLLNTLNELAAALGDDEDFATTVTASLALKAPKASPTFTGTVAIPNISDLESAVTANTVKLTANTANVTAAGALMDSEVDADIKTLSLPADTTISDFGKTLVDDANASTARTTLGVDVAGTDNSTNVTLAGTPDYLTISGQTITRSQIDLTDDVTGNLPDGNIASAATWNAKQNALPSLVASRFLTSDGSTLSWGEVDAFPSQSSQSGRFLTTNGSAVSWADLPQSGHDIIDETGSALTFRDNMTFKGELVAATDDGSSSTDITMDAKTSWLYG